MEAIENIQASPEAQIEAPMNIDQASQFIHKTKAAIYTMVCRGMLKAHKFGGQLYFFPSELVSQIKAGSK